MLVVCFYKKGRATDKEKNNDYAMSLLLLGSQAEHVGN